MKGGENQHQSEKSRKIQKSRSLMEMQQFHWFHPQDSEIKVLLMENISAVAVKAFQKAGFQVEHLKGSLEESELIEKIQGFHIIGIRSKTKLTKKVIENAKSLVAVGCFCIGTNQVDLDAAANNGIAVFNSPFSNSRSVAELMIAEIVMLARQLGDRNNEMHNGVWNKVSNNCFEIRGKTLGIVGYGHIGSQLSVLAEAMGMNVVFFDILQLMSLGTAKSLDSLEDLLAVADFVTLHVPETPDTVNMISARELKLMKKGSYLINASRGTVVDLEALKAALDSNHLAGASIDVYPVEPRCNGSGFFTGLETCPNIILTPHIGGSTEEAQFAIGVEVSSNLIKYLNFGTSLSAVNFPEIDLRALSLDKKAVRILNVHLNVPGVLKQLNKILSDHNIEKQICDSKGSIAYFMADISLSQGDLLKDLYQALEQIPESLNTRVLW